MVESTALLPQHSSQFQDKAFWAQFFKESQKQESFEWYSEFEELLQYLQVVLPAAKDGRILVPGCGDSLLSEKLALQMGFQDVVSVDFEPDVITRMQSRGTKGVTYEVVDITQMKYETGFFASILDKGTFDALCVDMKPETTLQCTKYLAESVRVLKNGGSFLAVSLLQDFVIDTLLEFFSKGSFDVRVYAIQPATVAADKGPTPSQPGTLSTRVRYLPFLLEVIKLESGSAKFSFKSHLEEQWTECSRNDLITKVQVLQNQRFVEHTKMFKQGQRYELASSEMKDNVPRYSLTVLDAQDESLLAQKTVGVFVVPLGVEREMDIYNEVEQRALFEVAKFARLIIVILGKTHKYESIDQIKEELNAKILGLTPPDCANHSSIPYMSTNKTLHVRDYVYEDAEMWVQDFQETGEDGQSQFLRQVFFQTNPRMVQSEVPLVYRNPKAIQILPHMQAKSPICPKKKQRELIFDRDVLTCEYHSAMLAGLSLIGDDLVEKVKAGEKINVLVLGTGAGVFSMFLRHHFNIHVDQLVTVDINPGVIKVAQEFFGFHPDEVLKSEIADAFAFVQAQKPESYDIVIMDVNYEEEDVKVSPPKKFFEPEFIRQLHAIAKPTALIAFNSIVAETHKAKLHAQLKQVKDSVKFITKAQNDKNEVLLFAKGLKDPKTIDEGPKRMQQLTRVCEAYGLNKGIFLSKKNMQVVHHTDSMRRL